MESQQINKAMQHDPVTPAEAQAALAQAEATQASSLKKALYSRWYAAAIALWAGLLAATIGHWAWPLVLAAGLVGHQMWRKRRLAWVKEIQTQRDAWVVLIWSMGVGALFIGAYITKVYFGLAWFPPLAGMLIALLLFTLMEVSYRAVRSAQTVD